MPTQVHKQLPLHQGRVFTLYRETVTLENGVTTDLDIIRHPGASAIVPLIDNHTVILLRQYRHAVGREIWEIPAGTLEDGETPLDCAHRELPEETGYCARHFHEIGTLVPVPGYSDERVHLFIAIDLTPAEQSLDADEIIHVHPRSLSDALSMIRRGDIIDAKTISALFLTRDWIAGRLK